VKDFKAAIKLNVFQFELKNHIFQILSKVAGNQMTYQIRSSSDVDSGI
jgi:hypothetical protein